MVNLTYESPSAAAARAARGGRNPGRVPASRAQALAVLRGFRLPPGETQRFQTGTKGTVTKGTITNSANFAQIRPIPYKFGKNTWTYTPVYCLQIRPISHKFGQIRANLVNFVCFHIFLIYGTVCYGTVSSVSTSK